MQLLLSHTVTKFGQLSSDYIDLKPLKWRYSFSLSSGVSYRDSLQQQYLMVLRVMRGFPRSSISIFLLYSQFICIYADLIEFNTNYQENIKMLPTITFNHQLPTNNTAPGPSHGPSFGNQYFNPHVQPLPQTMKQPHMLPPPVKFIGSYVIDYNREIGHGNFSHVYVAIDQRQPNIKLAVKVVNVESLREQNLEHLVKCEVQILLAARNQYIIYCKDALWDSIYCYIFTEYCEGGSLQSKIQKSILDYKTIKNPPIQEQLLEYFQYKLPSFQERQMIPMIRDIFNALIYLEKCHIIHRDIKAANIFIKEGKAIVADFGFARYVHEPFYDLNIGSLPFMPPEAITKNFYSNKTDVWAFGCLLFEIFHGQSPFAKSIDMKQLVKKAYSPLSVTMIRNDLSTEMKQLILVCLEIDMEKRKTFSQIEKLWCFKKLFGTPSQSVYLVRNDSLKLPNSIRINGKIVSEGSGQHQNQNQFQQDHYYRSSTGTRSFGSRFKDKVNIGNGSKNMNYSSDNKSNEKMKRIERREDPYQIIPQKEIKGSQTLYQVKTVKAIPSHAPLLPVPEKTAEIMAEKQKQEDEKVPFKDVLLRIQEVRNYYKLAITLKDRNKRIIQIKNRLLAKSVKQISKIENLIEKDKIDLESYDRNKQKQKSRDTDLEKSTKINVQSRKAKLTCIIKDYKTQFQNQMKRRGLDVNFPEAGSKNREVPAFLVKKQSGSTLTNDKSTSNETEQQLYGIVKNGSNFRQKIPILSQDMEYIIQTELVYHAEDTVHMSYEDCQNYRNKIKQILQDIMHLEHGYLNNEMNGNSSKPINQTLKNLPSPSRSDGAKALLLSVKQRPIQPMIMANEMDELSRLRWKQKSNYE